MGRPPSCPTSLSPARIRTAGPDCYDPLRSGLPFTNLSILANASFKPVGHAGSMNMNSPPLRMTPRLTVRQRAAAARFLKLARRVAEGQLESYSSKYSKKRFTRPQIMACLMLKQYLGLGFRALDALLSRDPRFKRALGVAALPTYVTLSIHAARAGSDMATRLLLKALRRSPEFVEIIPAAPDALGQSHGEMSLWLPASAWARSPGLLAFPARWTDWTGSAFPTRPGFSKRRGVMIVRRQP